jgi:hypothetical protein
MLVLLTIVASLLCLQPVAGQFSYIPSRLFASCTSFPTLRSDNPRQLQHRR